jgi:hypothetical protein
MDREYFWAVIAVLMIVAIFLLVWVIWLAIGPTF